MDPISIISTILVGVFISGIGVIMISLGVSELREENDMTSKLGCYFALLFGIVCISLGIVLFGAVIIV